MVVFATSALGEGIFLGYATYNEDPSGPQVSRDGEYLAVLGRLNRTLAEPITLRLLRTKTPSTQHTLFIPDEGERVASVRFSRDNLSLVYLVTGNDNRLVRVDLTTLEQNRVTPPDVPVINFYGTFDNDIIYRTSGESAWLELYRATLDGAILTPLSPGMEVRSYSARPDSSHVVFSTLMGEVAKVPREGGIPEVITAYGEAVLISVTSSFDGKFIVHSLQNPPEGSGFGELRVANLTGSVVEDVVDYMRPINAFNWIQGTENSLLMSGYGPGLLPSDPRSHQLRIHNFGAGTTEVFQMPEGFEATYPIWNISSDKIGIGLGDRDPDPNNSGFFSISPWALDRRTGSLTPLLPDLTKRTSFYVANAETGKVIRSVFGEYNSLRDLYLANLGSDDTAFLSSDIDTWCFASEEEIVVVVEQSPKTRRILSLDIGTRIRTQVGSVYPLQSRPRVGNCGSMSNDRLFLRYGDNTIGNFSTRERWLSEAPLFAASFEAGGMLQ